MNLRRTPRLVAALGSTLAVVTLTGAATGLTLRDIENIILRAHPLPPGILKGCPTPSISVCQAEMQTGGLCASSNRVACTTIIQDAFAASWDADRGAGSSGPPICHQTNAGVVCGDPVGGIGLQNAILPPAMTRSGFLWNDVALEPFDLKALTSSGSVSSDLSYASIIQTADLPAFGTSLLDLPNLTPRTPTAFTADGNDVRTCAEYVYKKNWDYVRFEEAALSCRTDWLCVYDAFSRTGSGDFGLAKPTLYSSDLLRNPAPIQVRRQSGPLPAAQTQKKNGFFPQDVNPTIFTSALRAHTTGVEAAAISAALATDYAADYTYTDRVDFHIARHDAQVAETGGIGLTLPEYKEHERRLATYGELLSQYRALRDADPTSVNSSLDPSLFDACGNALSIDPVTGLPFDTKCKKTGPFKPKPGTAAAALAAVVDSLAAFLVTEWHHKSFIDGVTVDHGCLATDSTRCDWSPKQVATEFLHLGMTQREHDYAHCVVETAENFATQFPSMDPKPPAFRDARSDWDAFEQWMERADVDRGEITKDIPWVGDDTLGTSKAGTLTIGDTDWFAASYDYEASWSVHVDKVVDPASGALKVKRICRSQGKATGKLVAKVWAVKQSFDVIDAYLNVHAGTSGVGGAAGDPSTAVTAKLYLLGAAIYAEKTTPSFDFAPEPKTDGIGHEEIVFVGPVPVTLGAKVDFSAGFTAHAGATAPQPADAACNFDDPAGVQIDANVTPYGRATAAAYGAIGGEIVGLGAEAGVEGHITLVDAKVPTSATVKFGGHTKFDGSEVVPSVHVTLNTSLDLEFMSGGVVAYAEICYLVGCKRTERPIFTWPGIRVNESIWTPLDKDYPIPALQVAVPPKPVPATP